MPPTPETLDLLNGLLAYDPRKRLTTRDAAAHPYFTSWPLPQPPEAMPSFAAHSFSRHTGVRLGVGVGVGLLTVQLVPDEGRLGRDSLEEIWGDIGEISGRYTEDIGAA